jgi:serine phosphatase RsbU (regulator of sigma subunit)/catechol 2,3-dioxygenase-like lactoylglutathione lyase family enzyme
MSSDPTGRRAKEHSFRDDHKDLHLRLNSVTVFVRDQNRSLGFYLDQLGFRLAQDVRLPTGDRWLAVSPPDGTTVIALVTPKPDSDDYNLIGRSTLVAFLTDDIFAKFEEWHDGGVRFRHLPQLEAWGGMSATFEDVDGNSFALVSYEQATREIEAHRRAHNAKSESERRAAQELETARVVQARLFPQVLPVVTTLDYAGVCIPARAVGGDYYDFIDLGRQHLGLVIGDISGKGTAAALLMSNLQAHMRNLCATYWSRPYTPLALEQPERLLRAVNQLFYENTNDNTYATLIFAEYDDTKRRLRYANCGHLSALLLRSDGALERLDSTCPLLGVFKRWDCSVEEHHLFPGDTLALYTDGVTESFNDAEEEFGEQRLIEAMRRHRGSDSQALLQSIANEVHQFGSDEQSDDVTLVIAKCR